MLEISPNVEPPANLDIHGKPIAPTAQTGVVGSIIPPPPPPGPAPVGHPVPPPPPLVHPAVDPWEMPKVESGSFVISKAKAMPAKAKAMPGLGVVGVSRPEAVIEQLLVKEEEKVGTRISQLAMEYDPWAVKDELTMPLTQDEKQALLMVA